MEPRPDLSRRPRGARTLLLASLACGLALAGCATAGRGPTELYTMPSHPSLAMTPEQADPDHPGELAESAFGLLDPERPGGPDYLGAARMCLLAAEIAHPRAEADLRRACFRLAARSSLRAGEREAYLDAVARWEAASTRSERAAGELAIHTAIARRLAGEPAVGRTPTALRRLLPPTESAESAR